MPAEQLPPLFAQKKTPPRYCWIALIPYLNDIAHGETHFQSDLCFFSSSIVWQILYDVVDRAVEDFAEGIQRIC